MVKSTRGKSGGKAASQTGPINIDNGPQSRRYTKVGLTSYNSERLVTVGEAQQMIEAQPYLDGPRFLEAMKEDQIQVYEYRGEKWVDRIDLGRVYYDEPQHSGGLKIDRHFSKVGEDPLDLAGPYERRDVAIPQTGFVAKDVEFPSSWFKRGETEPAVITQKYFMYPNKQEWKDKLTEKVGRDHEHSLKHLVTRVSNFFADEGYRLGYFNSEADRDAFRDELAALQVTGRFAFNSPAYFNAGLFNEYGIEGTPSISYTRNGKTGEVMRVKEGCYVHPQLHACFIRGITDDLEDILSTAIDEGAIFALGSGIGENIGALRGDGEQLSSGGKASGPLSFMRVYDVLASTIKSGGKSRRAARMQVIRQHHRDVMKLIRCKVWEDKKTVMFMENGYPIDMDTVSDYVFFQNTNISVRLDDHFFKQLARGGKIELKNVTDHQVVEAISAERMLKEISFGSWRVGDPAVQYESEIQRMHTCPNSGRQNSSNPCSEYLFLDDTSCNLGSLNPAKFANEKGEFDPVAYARAARIATIALNIANEAASYSAPRIAELSPEFATIGLGHSNSAALLMRRGQAYDSDAGRNFEAALTALTTGIAAKTSTELAEQRGTFIHWNFNRDAMLSVVGTHQKNLEQISWDGIEEGFKPLVEKTWSDTMKRGKTYGFANAQFSCLAPTGTISFLMNCDTTGIEPSLSLGHTKKLAGGGSIFIPNHEVPTALENLGYDDAHRKIITNFIENNGHVIGAPGMDPTHYPVFETAMGGKKGLGQLPLEAHLRFMGAAQPFLSGGISKTNNLGKRATVADVYRGYELGYKLRLKGLAVFRGGSKALQVLSTGNSENPRALKWGQKRDLEGQRLAMEREVNIGGKFPLHIITSEYPDGRPGQIAFLALTEGSSLGGILKSHGVLASKALKRGLGLEGVIASWKGHKIEPSGIVYNNPYIKSTRSPLDLASNVLDIEYRGNIAVAENPFDVDITQLRGYQNGAFLTYARDGLDEWEVDQVLADPILGGFAQGNKETVIKTYLKQQVPIEHLKAEEIKKHIDGTRIEGNDNGDNDYELMDCPQCQDKSFTPLGPGCAECFNCGHKIGGCAA